jgi:hypothetical protein
MTHDPDPHPISSIFAFEGNNVETVGKMFLIIIPHRICINFLFYVEFI